MHEVHPPHEAVHAWRGFLLHIATIVIGLLIAVLLEQTVEVRQWMLACWRRWGPTFLEAHGMTRSLLLLLIGALTAGAPSIVRSQDKAATSIGNSQVEEIYVARAVRQSRIPPTRFCDESRIGFGKTLFEDHFAFRSIQTDPSDGRMVSSDAQAIGNMHVCFGAPPILPRLAFTPKARSRAFRSSVRGSV